MKDNQYFYYINLDERGEFYADVRDRFNDTVYEIKGYDIFEDGFMEHKNDLNGLCEYLVSLSVLPSNAILTVE